MLFVKKYFFGGVLGMMVMASSCYGSASGDLSARQQGIILKEQERLKELTARSRRLTPPPKQADKKEEKEQKVTKRHFKFEDISLKGVTRLDAETLVALTRPYINKPVSVDHINQLLSDVTEAYFERGFVTARVYLDGQQLNAGKLVITVVEGKIASYQHFHKGEAVPFKSQLMSQEKDKLLNLRDVEQATDHIARLETYDVTSDIQPAGDTGESHLILRTTQSLPFVLRASRDTDGSPSTGIRQGEAQLILEDLSGFYERIVGTYKRDLDLEDRHHFSKSFTLQASVPYRLWLVSYAGSFFNYRSTQKTRAFDFRLDGHQQNHRLEAQILLSRDSVSKTNLIGFFSHKGTSSYIEGEVLRTASYSLNSAGLGGSYVRRVWEGVFSGTFVSSFSRKRNPHLGSEDPQTGQTFLKHTLDLGYVKPFSIFGGNWLWKTQMSAQYAGKDLVSLERFSIGSPYTVRGFRDTSLSGSSGFFVRQELSWTFFQPTSSRGREFVGEVSFFQGLDYGWIRPHKEDPFERGKLLSASTGLRFEGGRLWGEASISTSLASPSFLKKEPTLFRLKVGVKL